MPKILEFRWKGKIVTEKQYNLRKKQSEIGKNRKKSVVEEDSRCTLEGQRIVEFQVMAALMYCTSCKELLALSNIASEKKQGLGSIFHIRCHYCLMMNFVPSGKRHASDSKQSKVFFDSNSKAALATLHAGFGFSSVNSFMHLMNIPFMSSRTFKQYEREMGPIAELVAKESCNDATKLERSLTINMFEDLEKKLPEEFQKGFLIPKFVYEETAIIPSTSQSAPIESSSPVFMETVENESSNSMSEVPTSSIQLFSENGTETSCFTPIPYSTISSASEFLPIESPSVVTTKNTSNKRSPLPDETEEEYCEPFCTIEPQSFSTQSSDAITSSTSSFKTPTINSTADNFDDVVRLLLCYDMGYSTRSSGLNYDSLNGYGTMIGSLSRLVVSYTTRNRKCRLCELGHPREDHDCRLNFYGTAKAMEADAAVQLCVDNDIFKSNNVEIGVFISDNDSSSTCAIRKKKNRPFVKQSDRNHTCKGVKNLLYKTANKSEITGLTGDAIKYLYRCFTYAIAQNEGETEKMKNAILNIPYHAYDDHSNCGEWCGYRKDAENYTHTTISPDKFQNEKLREELIKIFKQLSDNVAEYSTLASTQANESLNSIISRKAPKAISYSQSESTDFRVACAVAQKNRRHQYLQDVLVEANRSPGSQLTKYIQQMEKSHRVRALKAKAPEFKRKRQLLKKTRTQLKHAKESIEENKYESHISLLTLPEDESTHCDSTDPELVQLSSNIDFGNTNEALVFFDLETSGRVLDCDVLQIAARYNNEVFNKYIEPKHPIPPSVSSIHGLTNVSFDMFLHGRKVITYPLKIVLQEFLNFSINRGKKCILIAHNVGFDAPRLIKIMKQVSLQDEFSKAMEGFADTLVLCRRKFPGADCSLKKLTSNIFFLDSHKMHDANYDVLMLQNLAFYHFTIAELLSKVKNFIEMLQFSEYFESLTPLKSCVSELIRKKMAYEGIHYNILSETFHLGEKKLIKLLEKKDSDGKKLITKKQIKNKIVIHFQKLEE